jgi:hypothetical protein
MDGSGGPDNAFTRASRRLNQRIQVLLDKSSPQIAARWAALLLVLVAYILRVWLLRGAATAVLCSFPAQLRANKARNQC